MKLSIHPNYVDATVTCSCGSTFQTRSTRAVIRTDLCSVCHPFYTGEQRIVDTAGQVERFTRHMEAAAANAGQKSSASDGSMPASLRWLRPKQPRLPVTARLSRS